MGGAGSMIGVGSMQSHRINRASIGGHDQASVGSLDVTPERHMANYERRMTLTKPSAFMPPSKDLESSLSQLNSINDGDVHR